MLRRSQVTPRAVNRTAPDTTDGTQTKPTVIGETPKTSKPQQQQQLLQSSKLIIRAAKSPERTSSPDYVRTPATVVGPTTALSSTGAARLARQGAYVNIQGEGKTATSSFRAINGKRITVRNFDSAITNGKTVTNASDKIKHPIPIRFRNGKVNGSLERKAVKPHVRQNINRLDVMPMSLRQNGNTPKLIRRLPVMDINDILTNGEGKPNDSPVGNKENSDSLPNGVIKINSSPKNERKLKRSESYRLANSPIMFIKRFSSIEKSPSKIVRTASEELREDLLKEKINYPETVASPEPDDIDMNDHETIETGDISECGIFGKLTTLSPRPRENDIEPARVLKYTGLESEIW